MQRENEIGQWLDTLHFTNKMIADYCGVSESMIKQVRQGKKKSPQHLTQNIKAFICEKIEQLEPMLREKGESR